MELDQAVAVAREKGQAQAMVSASALRAKLAGLMVEKVEVSSADPFENCETMADVADRWLAEEILRFRPVDQADRDGLIALLQRQAEETNEYLAAIRARPVLGERVDAADLSTPWQQLKPYAARRITNGIRR